MSNGVGEMKIKTSDEILRELFQTIKSSSDLEENASESSHNSEKKRKKSKKDKKNKKRKKRSRSRSPKKSSAKPEEVPLTGVDLDLWEKRPPAEKSQKKRTRSGSSSSDSEELKRLNQMKDMKNLVVKDCDKYVAVPQDPSQFEFDDK